MIEVHLDRCIITVKGHASRSEGAKPGQNIVCAAVSALTLTLISGLEDIAQDRIAYSAETGDVVIEWNTISDIGSSLISTWFLGILRIRDAYGEILII